VRCIPVSERSEWEATLAATPHAFGHTWGYCRAQQLTHGCQTLLLVANVDGARAVCPLVVRPVNGRADVATPFGFSGLAGSGPCPELPELWRALARQQGWVCGYVTIHPVLGHASFADPREVDEVNETYLIDLRDGPEGARRSLSENRRRQLRDWWPGMHDGEPGELTRFFVDEYPRSMERKAAPERYRFSGETLRALCELPDVLLLGARAEGRLQSVSIFGHTAHGGDFLFNAALPGAERHSAMLIWSAAHRLAELGVPWLNLGGGLQRGDSLARFKARFGGPVLPMRAVKAVYDPAAYAELCKRSGADPAAREGFFPPYRQG
jgi:hypothetical protein